MLLDKMVNNGVSVPYWLPSNTICLVYMGSRAYGCETKDSDYDTYGVCFPTLDKLIGFPDGYFEQWHPKSIIMNEREYDITVYSIVKFFKLAMQNNPNIIDFLFVPRKCIIHSTNVWDKIRDNRKLFLHKGCWHRFKNYAASQLTKLNHKEYVHSKRIKLVEEHGYDTKFGMNLVRLILECEQILTEHDLDLTRHSDILKAVRKGEWSLEKLNTWFDVKESQVEKFYEQSTLRVKPDIDMLNELLMDSLRTHYSNIPVVNNTNLLDELKQLVNKHEVKND